MFEPLNNSTPSINSCNFQSSFGRVNYFKATRPSSNTDTESRKAGTGAPSKAAPEQPEKNITGLRHIVIQYSIHQKTGKTIIEVVDKDNNEVIREIPSREDLERSARLQTYVGQLFDEIA